jgi:indole-3-glycerol phosphate synthase/phosphoribosylanthranilate isomerase
MTTTGTILDKIVADKLEWIKARKAAQPLSSFKASVVPSDRSFYEALSGTPAKFILECKKASPSKGLIRNDFNLDAIASVYKNYAAAISVLTDEKYFQGDFSFVTQVRSQVSQPVLCKDFFVDPYQVYLARHHSADVILLMLSVLDDEQYANLAELAHSLNMGVLTEVSNLSELKRAIALNAKVIGINNRDLRDLSIDLSRTEQLASQIPADRIIVSESGIYRHDQVRRLAKHANAFLVGSSLMSQDNIDLACRRLILGDNKVCGLTRPEDAVAVYKAGAVYGGLIFAEKSPRCVSGEQARLIAAAAPLQYVGVFVNATIESIAKQAAKLGLAAVQLHGDEDADYIALLRQQLPAGCAIWKALGVTDALPKAPEGADRILYDAKVGSQNGGTGQTFNWQLLSQAAAGAMIAGGLNAANAIAAAELGGVGLDFNSGVETAPGIKDRAAIAQAFANLRQY